LADSRAAKVGGDTPEVVEKSVVFDGHPRDALHLIQLPNHA
jgi:hypothetical protein